MLRSGKTRVNPQKASKASEVFLGVGLLVAVIGAGKYTLAKSVYTKQSVAFPSSNTERRLAIIQARVGGNSNYGFTTNFIPGIGIIANPEEFLRKFREQATTEDSR